MTAATLRQISVAAPRRWLAALGSARLALVLIALLGAAVLATYLSALRSPWPLAAALALIALNLCCAVLVNAVFRRQTALLAFHLALIAIALLAAAGRLTYLKGQLELSTGETFTGELTQSESGPWHRSRLAEAGFTSLGFTIAYHPGVKRDRTANTVVWRGRDGRQQRAVIGDSQPLVLAGYRFYTSPNKGFAPMFTWLPAQGAPQRGTIHLPSYPMNEYRQALEWTPPGSAVALWTMLQFDEVLLDPQQASQFRLPERHVLVVRAGGERHELRPGERLAFAQGVLVYEGLTTWMGYTVFYDWTLPWILAACLVAVACLGWHFRARFAARPWGEA